MTILDSLVDRACQSPARIVLPEGEDPRIIEGAVAASAKGFATPVLIGNPDIIRPVMATHGAETIEIIDPHAFDKREAYAEQYHLLRQHKGVSLQDAQTEMTNPLVLGQMMVRLGDVDGSVAGAVASTSDTVRTALQIIGKNPTTSIVSSYFLMIMDQPHHPVQGPVLFADCALNIEPSDRELADIALSTVESWQSLFGEEPKLAMLSFSTKGSARHARVDKVVSATKLVNAESPTLAVDGDLQFDAAIMPAIAETKAKGSAVAGKANIFVFPDLDSGNIGYKIAQRIGGAQAIGPVLQGLKQPANDLSRGCSVEDVYNLIAITTLQVAQSSK